MGEVSDGLNGVGAEMMFDSFDIVLLGIGIDG